jgi:hypothetical protein
MDVSDSTRTSKIDQGINALTKFNQWIIWKKVVKSDGRVDKIPLNHRTFKPADAHDSNIWTTYEQAIALAKQMPIPGGYGFVFTRNDPFFFVDIDDCVMPDGKNWQPIVGKIYGKIPHAAVGVSQSGRGLHIIGTGTAIAERRCKAEDLFDLYTEGRFVAISGRGFTGDASIDQTAGLTQIVDRWLTLNGDGTREPAEWTTTPEPAWKSLTDDEILSRARGAVSAKSVFGGAVTFAQLWDVDEDALGTRWPDDKGLRAFDRSDADSALAQHLAFWTGKNCEHVRELMYKSGLDRDKWHNRPEYLERTILAAVGRQNGVYTGGRKAMTPNTAEGVKLREGFQYMPVAGQIEHFKGCTYIGAMHCALVPGGHIYKPDRFRAEYGGYVFAWDNSTDGKTTRNAWDVFTESQGYNFPKIDNICFRPGRVDGPVDVFLDHIHRLLPVESDREILLSYMAACVQLAGTKFQWAPCVQGVDGNGKSVLYSVLEYALGAKYCHQIDPNDLDNKFNAWIERKLLACVEEIRVSGNKIVIDKLKPMLTNRRVPLQAKGMGQRTGDNCANFLFFSNHKDAVHKTVNDRRYSVFYTAQQEVEDLTRDGMDGGYFSGLYGWLEGGGYGAVSHYLATREITVDVMGRAPRTSCTDEAIFESRGIAEQRLLVAIDTGEPGFTGEIIDFGAADRLLRSTYKTMSPKALNNALKNIGYVQHPIKRFRINGVRRRLYAKKDSAILEIVDNEQLSQIYLSTISL